MFTNYKIVNNTLYLYVDYRCEIGSLFDDKKNLNLADKIKQYIKDKKINFNGTKVVLLLSGLMLGSMYLNNMPKADNYDVYKDNKYVYNIVDKSNLDVSVDKKIDEIINEATEKIKEEKDSTSSDFKEKKEVNNITSKKVTSNKTISSNQNISINQNTSSNETTNSSNDYNKPNYKENNVAQGKVITLRRTNGEVLQINLEEYLIGVVAAEMPAFFNEEALKAQAVVARTYTLKLIETGRELTDNVSTQAYKSNGELQSMWGSNYNKYYNKIKDAVSKTNGLCIKYNGSLIDAVYHSTSNGYTEDAVNVWKNDVPYLKTVTSPWDTSASSFLRTTNVGFNKISNVLGINFNSSSSIEIISKDESGRISRIKFNDKEITGIEIRNLLGLRSTDFDFNITDNGVAFTTRGYGHGVGMSQYGANGMASAGYTFDKILNYYYPGVQIVKGY